MDVNREASSYSRAVADEIVGIYKKKRMTQPQLAELADINPTTLQRLLAGKSEMLVDQLIALCGVLGVSPGKVVEDAENALAMSEAATTTNDLDTKRKQNEARSMTTEQIETTKHAATRDPEMDNDEPN